MKTNLPHSTKTKKVWQKPTLTVMSSTEQIQGGAPNINFYEAGQAFGNRFLAAINNPANKFVTNANSYYNYGQS